MDKRKKIIAGKIAVVLLSFVFAYLLWKQYNELSLLEERLDHIKSKMSNSKVLDEDDVKFASTHPHLILTPQEDFQKDLSIHFFAAIIMFIVAVLLYKPFFSLFFEEDTVSIIKESSSKIQNMIRNSFVTNIEKDISFTDIYIEMERALAHAKRRIYVTSFIGDNPEDIPNSKTQKIYHATMLKKLKVNLTPHVYRIVSIQNERKLEWVLDKLNVFEKNGLANASVYYSEEASAISHKKYLPINVQIYDDVVIILNTDFKKDNDITDSKSIYFRDKNIADIMEKYFLSLKQCCGEDCLYFNGRIKMEVIKKIESKLLSSK
jgi:hypothetical protein